MIRMEQSIESARVTRQPEPAAELLRLPRGLQPPRGPRIEVHGNKPSLSPSIHHRADTEWRSNPHVRRGAGKTPSPTRTSGRAGVRSGNAEPVLSPCLPRKSTVFKTSLGHGEA